MSIPTNNLYNFVAQALENKFLIKYFYPWGEKGFVNLINNTEDKILIDQEYKFPNHNITNVPVVLCHDQEPLHFDLYNDTNMLEQLDNLQSRKNIKYFLNKKSPPKKYKNMNLRWTHPTNTQDTWILLHSELNSDEVKKYQNTGLFKCAYWWSHAIISRDWYRFADYDKRLQIQSQDIKANWLVYARGQDGNRSYRKEFLKNLTHIDSVQVGSFARYEVSGGSSATYDHYDFTHTNCSIVLETIFDQRIHLTEKTLRPIACGHPFIILNGPGTLEKIRSYGFKTFEPYIDESYDKEQSSKKRMEMVLGEMHRINKASLKDQNHIWNSCRKIAQHNKRLFFNEKFISSIKAELTNAVFSI